MTFVLPRRGRQNADGQISELTITDLDGNSRLVFATSEVIEAPNWTGDGKWLVFNGGGLLFKISPDGGQPERIDIEGLDDLNNDHVLSPDGSTIYVSSNDGHLYAVPFAGGAPRRVSNEHRMPHHYYLHGVSPDGLTLAYVAIEKSNGEQRINVFTIPANGGPDTRLTDVSVPNDGPEFSPDGRWIYFNSEMAGTTPGHAQIFRMRAADGRDLEQLTFDEQVNWFPHISPDGEKLVYLAFPPGTRGHPANKHVSLKLMSPTGGVARTLTSIVGGQGTINVNSWAPDSRRFAFVAYPVSPSGKTDGTVYLHAGT